MSKSYRMNWRLQRLFNTLKERAASAREAYDLALGKIRPSLFYSKTGEDIIRTGPDGSPLAPGQSYSQICLVSKAPIDTIKAEIDRLRRVIPPQIQREQRMVRSIYMSAFQGNEEAKKWVKEEEERQRKAAFGG